MTLGRTVGLGGLALYMVLITGLIMGVNAGYTADAPQDTEIYLDGDTLHVGNNTTNVSFDQPPPAERNATNGTQSLEDLPVDEEQLEVNLAEGILPSWMAHRLNETTQAFAERMYWTLLGASIHVADAAATWTYHNQWWLPSPLANFGLTIAAVAPVGGYGYRIYREVRAQSR